MNSAVFHTTGMGGQAFETLAARGAFACVMDFSLVEVSNDMLGSVVSAGRDWMTAAGAAGVPQIIAPGGVSLIDMRAWAAPPDGLGTREVHAHNRLIACALMTTDEKILAAKAIAAKANAARGATRVVMPLDGIDEWDRPGGPFNDPNGLQAFTRTLQDSTAADRFETVQAHINDTAFADRVLAVSMPGSRTAPWCDPADRMSWSASDPAPGRDTSKSAHAVGAGRPAPCRRGTQPFHGSRNRRPCGAFSVQLRLRR